MKSRARLAVFRNNFALRYMEASEEKRRLEKLAWLEARRKEKEEDARRRRRLSQDDPTPSEALLLRSPDSARKAQWLEEKRRESATNLHRRKVMAAEEERSMVARPSSPELARAAKRDWQRQVRASWEASLQRRRVLAPAPTAAAPEEESMTSMIAAFSELAGSMSPRTSPRGSPSPRPAPAEVADPAEIADATATARALKQQWLQERRREWAAALMARQNTKLNQGEQLVLDGWLERIYAEGGVAESDGQLAARLKRQFVAFERSQWEARAARRKAMADSEGADGRVVVEANESDLDAQAKMEWVRRRRAEAELSLARRRSLASLSDGRYVEDPRLVKERWLKERRQEWEAMVKRRRALAKEERSLIEQRLLSNPALLASLVDAMVDGGTLPESCGGDALGDEDPSFVLDLIKAHLTAARDSAAQLRDRLLEGTQMPVRPLVIERPHAPAPAPSFDA